MSEDNYLLNFLADQENAQLAAGDLSMLRHKSPEGGTDTIGFGHKLTKQEMADGKVYGVPLHSLDMKGVKHILQIDLANKKKTLDASLRKKHGVRLDSLSPRKKMMLLDYEFNLAGGAVKKFPSFTAGVLANDDAVQKHEYVRHYTDDKGKKHTLARNGAFYKAFMSNEAKAQLGE